MCFDIKLRDLNCIRNNLRIRNNNESFEIDVTQSGDTRDTEQRRENESAFSLDGPALG